MNRFQGSVVSMLSVAIALAITSSGSRVFGEGRKVDGRANVQEAVDRPNGEYHLQELNGQSYVKLSGRVGTLRIGKIDGQSTLDASCLDAALVIVEDKIDGQSDLIIKTSSFRFREINGQSVVLITH